MRAVFLPLLLLPALTDAADPATREAVARLVDAEYASLELSYRDLHAHPELSFMDVRTAGILARELKTLGYEVTEKVGHTGVVAVLRNGAGPTVMLRADMDALPMEEKTGLPYASKGLAEMLTGSYSPAMHSCAHDMHVTSLIGAARVLAARKDRWVGTLVLIGQPAEEIGADPAAIATASSKGEPLPSDHSPFFAPAPEPTLKAGLTALVAGVLDLMPGR